VDEERKGVKVRIKYAVSLWNYSHYAHVPSLEHVITFLRERGYGVELWGTWKKEENLFDEVGRRRLKYILQGMEVSLHSAEAETFDLHRMQIDAAADFGAEIVVVHPIHFRSKDNSDLDVRLACKITAYAAEKGVTIALENGLEKWDLAFLVNAIKKVEGLGICLDVGHVYFTGDPLSKYLNALKERIIHLHIQDTLASNEPVLPYIGKDHYIPGTGGIPDTDWKLLATTLKEIDFQGMAVFEIRPRDPLQAAFLGRTFMEELLEKQ